MSSTLDLLLINPSGRKQIYQDLGDDLTAIEPPLWCRLIAGYVRDRGYSRGDHRRRGRRSRRPDAVAEMVAARAAAAGRHGGVRPSAVGVDPADGGGEPDLPRHQGARSRAAHHHRRRPCGGATGTHAARSGGRFRLQQRRPDHGPGIARRAARRRRRTTSPRCKDWCGGTTARFATTSRRRSSRISTTTCTAMCGTCCRWRNTARTTGNASAIWNRAQPYASIYTSLGCPYKCTFCCINAPFGTNRYRMRSPEGGRRRDRPSARRLRRQDLQDHRRDVRAQRAPRHWRSATS